MGKYREACLKVPGVREWVAEQTGKHFCECGCGSELKINPEHYYIGFPKFKQGHGNRRTKEQFFKDFWDRVEKTETCWIWKGLTGEDGYGDTSYLGVTEKVHRISYKLYFGEIPEDMQVCHHCDNPPCVNPNHFFLGTHQDNSKDKTLKCRAAKKLSRESVIEIVKLINSGWTYKEVGEKYKVGRVTVFHVMSGRTWSHVTGFIPKIKPIWLKTNGK